MTHCGRGVKLEQNLKNRGNNQLDESPDVTSPRALSLLFKKYGLKPRRQLGQNFLIDANIVRKIIKAAEISEDNYIIEIGPGAGALTAALARSDVRLAVLEIDRGLIRLLKDQFKNLPQVKIMERDVLEVEWEEMLIGLAGRNTEVKLISNLPYNISGPFMYNLFREAFPFSKAILMFQKEVAQRLLANPGDSDYGTLSVLSRYYCRGENLFDVSKNVFWPRPKVDSTVIRLTPRSKELSNPEEKLFWEIVQSLFQQRRKTILKRMSIHFNIPRNDLTELLKKAAIIPAARPEELDVNQFAKLARITYNYLNNISER